MAKEKEKVGDLGVSQVQEKVDAENAQGFRGVEVDPTPNENYTLGGVTKGLPTPETDKAAALDADQRHKDLAVDKFPAKSED